MSSANTARDMDQIRLALGEDKINFFGLSYGTALGGTYASLFPDRTDRMIIDSNTGGNAFDRDGVRRLARGARKASACSASGPRTGTTATVWAGPRVRSARPGSGWPSKLDAQPVAGLDGRLFRLVSFGHLYKDANFAGLAQLWQSLSDGDSAAVRTYLAEEAPAAIRATRTASEKAELSPTDNALSSFLAVTCNDSAWSRDVASYQRSVAEDRKKYPLFGAAAANITPCAFWESEPEVVEPLAEGPRNILIIQNRTDVATPYLGGVLARQAFGDRSRLVSVDGYGHGVYIFDDNPCALNVGTAYLVDGEFPRRDVSCRAERGSGLALNADRLRLRERTLEEWDSQLQP